MLTLSFSPLLPAWALWALAAAVAALVLIAALSRGPVALVRAAALALVVAALANPSLIQEEREKVKDVVAVVVDRSSSQTLGARAAMTDKVRAELQRRLGAMPDVEPRFVDAGDAENDDGTRLFSALSNALADVPPDRLAGVVMVTDGVVHDIPASTALLGFRAPLHALVTGRPDERDRRIALTEAPRFGIVGKDQTVRAQVLERGGTGSALVTVRRDGQQILRREVRTGAPFSLTVRIEHGGPNVVEIEAEALADELTTANNRAVVTIEGIREKLRVLLVSGEPHAGERTWRNLLKSDANVDLVHFTILRPPEKQDGTPINELSLIAFPTRELFQQKINEFQLIIFDRYARQGVLPIIYFDNITRYVRDGGAVLVAAGPDYASQTSIWRTPLDAILPAEPSGRTTEQPFHARLTDLGKRHPVTRGLEGAGSDPPHWSRFFRLVDTREARGTAVMDGPDGKPLLVLSREGEGRVALLLSDHIWLWARGYEGGGPHLDLLRRLSHWLMKQPDLEEEALRLSVQGKQLLVRRQTMGESIDDVTLTTPSGAAQTLTLKPNEPGLWLGSVEANELGLWRATDGKLTALINVGPANPREFAEVTSTTEVLGALTNATGGDARRLAGRTGVSVPRVLAVRSTDTYKGDDWIGVKMRDASVVRGIGVLPLFAGLIGLLLLIGSLAATWAREGR
ncbi:MAG: hypothetical protein ACJ8FU_01220 [Xanthobacteraceae bacterium]